MRPRPHSGRSFIQRIAGGLGDERPSRGRDDRQTVKQTIEERQLVISRDLRQNRRGGEPRVRRSREQKAQVLLGAGLMARRSGDDSRHVVGGEAAARRVAGGAVETDTREADRHSRKADRHVVAVFRQKADRRVAAWAREMLGKTRGSTSCRPSRECLPGLAAHGTEQKVILIGREIRPRLGPHQPRVQKKTERACRHDQCSSTFTARYVNSRLRVIRVRVQPSERLQVFDQRRFWTSVSAVPCRWPPLLLPGSEVS